MATGPTRTAWPKRALRRSPQSRQPPDLGTHQSSTQRRAIRFDRKGRRTSPDGQRQQSLPALRSGAWCRRDKSVLFRHYCSGKTDASKRLTRDDPGFSSCGIAQSAGEDKTTMNCGLSASSHRIPHYLSGRTGKFSGYPIGHSPSAYGSEGLSDCRAIS